MDEREDSRARRRIQDMRDQMQLARNQVWRQLVRHNSVDLQARADLAEAVVEYWDVLGEYRDERKDEWTSSEVDRIQGMIGETTQVEVESPGRGSGAATRERPALLTVEPMTLLDLSKRLDKLANNMGFSANASTRRNRFHIARKDPDEHPKPYNEQVARPGE